MSSQIPQHRPRRWRAWVRRVAIVLALGVGLTVVNAWLCALFSDPLLATASQTSGTIGDEAWSITSYRGVGSLFLTTSWQRGAAWSPHQVTGPPDAALGVDDRNAWASQSQDAGIEWLDVTFAKPVIPKELQVHETYCPGALMRVTAFNANGEEITAWAGTDPTAPKSGAGVSTVPLNVGFPIRRVKIYLDSAAVQGWNEIDAIGLVDQNQQVQWARNASASTWYGQSSQRAGGTTPFPKHFLPIWSGLDKPTQAFAEGEVSREDRAIDARGWPFLSLWVEREGLPTNSATWTQAPKRTFMPRGPTVPGPGGTMPPPIRLRPHLPYRPLWFGFGLNVFLHSVLAALVWWLATVPGQFLREVSRIRHGRCIRCGYDLRYDFVPGCPECGWRRDEQAAYGMYHSPMGIHEDA